MNYSGREQFRATRAGYEVLGGVTSVGEKRGAAVMAWLLSCTTYLFHGSARIKRSQTTDQNEEPTEARRPLRKWPTHTHCFCTYTYHIPIIRRSSSDTPTLIISIPRLQQTSVISGANAPEHRIATSTRSRLLRFGVLDTTSPPQTISKCYPFHFGRYFDILGHREGDTVVLFGAFVSPSHS